MKFGKMQLEWGNFELYCLENQKNCILVDAIERGIARGDKFPPVDLTQIGPVCFLIGSAFSSAGGHHRAIGHYRTGKPLPANIVDYSPMNPSHFTRVSDIKLFDHRKILDPILRQDAEEDFLRRARYYPCLNWEHWGLVKPESIWQGS